MWKLYKPIVKVSETLPILFADNNPNPEILEDYTTESFLHLNVNIDMNPYTHQYNESGMKRIEKFEYCIIPIIIKNTNSSNNNNNNNNVYLILFEYLIFNIKRII